jgi:hypothetical protein
MSAPHKFLRFQYLAYGVSKSLGVNRVLIEDLGKSKLHGSTGVPVLFSVIPYWDQYHGFAERHSLHYDSMSGPAHDEVAGLQNLVLDFLIEPVEIKKVSMLRRFF